MPCSVLVNPLNAGKPKFNLNVKHGKYLMYCNMYNFINLKSSLHVLTCDVSQNVHDSEQVINMHVTKLC